jgi:uncharacterized protein (DUF1015 family)
VAHLIPFNGVLYNGDILKKDIARVVAPPYDVIDATFQQALHARHPHNVIRLELGLDQPGDATGNNKYSRAAGTLQSWLAGGVLQRDAKPAIYPYAIEYATSSGYLGSGTRVLKGFVSTVKLEEFGTGNIYPHENTRAAAKSDRLNLMEACASNFSCIFSLFSDPEGAILGLVGQAMHAAPRIDFTDDGGCRQRLWTLTDDATLSKLTAAMASKPLFIADGHHRYETALNYRRLRRQQAGGNGQGLRPYDAVMMLFSSLEDPGLTVLPTHRVLRNALPPLAGIRQHLGGSFTIEECAFDDKTERAVRRQFITAMRTKGRSATVFGLASRNAKVYCLLSLKPEHRPAQSASERDRLDVSILESQVINRLCPTQADHEAILYTKDDEEALDLIGQGKGEAALLLNPTKVEEVRAVATAGGRMPHKSTYFYPKPLTGLVMNVME